jgi:hypothetical protein
MFGLVSEVCQTSQSPARCSLLILPSSSLLQQHVRDVHAVLDGGVDLPRVLPEPAVAGDATTGRSANALPERSL